MGNSIDNSRTQIKMELRCSKHPDQKLYLSSSGSKVGASSAYELNPTIMVHPCASCEMEHNSLRSSVMELMITAEGLKVARSVKHEK